MQANGNGEVKVELEEDLTDFVMPTSILNGPDQILPATDYTTTSPEGTVKLYDKGSRYIHMSIPGCLHRTVKAHPDLIALVTTPDVTGTRTQYTYQEYENEAKIIAKAFMKLGLKRHYSVAIIGFNSAEWFFSFMGAIYAGGIAAGMYTTNSPDACLYICEHCRANIIVVEDEVQLEKILKIRDRLPELKAIVQYRGVPKDKSALSWQELREMGEKLDDSILNPVLKSIGVNECCSLVYTSGTTGNPKGVMLSHDNLVSGAQAVCETMGLRHAEESLVSYLPLSHIAAQAVDIVCGAYAAMRITFADSGALKGTLVQTLLDVRPTAFFGVPRVWEKIYEKLTEVGRQNGAIKTAIVKWAKAQALDYYTKKFNEGIDQKTWSYMFAKWLVLNKVRTALGLERSHIFIAGAAPLSPEVMSFFASLDIPIMDCFGMSETAGAVTLNNNSKCRFGSLGLPVGEYLVKIDNPDNNGDGEICAFGRNIFMGYLNEPEKTKEAKDSDGYMHSGDLGKIDKDGFMYITGRIKELIITAGGENIAPVNVEYLILAELPALSNAILIGDKRKYLTVLVSFKTFMNNETGEPMDNLLPEVKDWAQSLGVNVNTVPEILADKNSVIYKEIEAAIDRANKNAVSNAQKVQKFRVMPHDFSIATGELGPTLKLRRNIVQEQYKDLIEEMYND